MQKYLKGARSERELLNRLYSMGYSVMRSAGSGVNSLGPDIIAMKDGVCLAFECKAWEKSRLSLDPEGYAKLAEWERNTRSYTYVAWRMNVRGWFFIRLDELKAGEKDYSITKKKTLEIGRILEHIIAASVEAVPHAGGAESVVIEETVGSVLTG